MLVDTEALARLMSSGSSSDFETAMVELARGQAIIAWHLRQRPESPGIEDRNLSVREAATRLGLSTDYLYRNKLPFTVRIGTRVLFSERGLERWNAQRKGARQ
jgi:excisionase family DNA binding protein